MLKLFRRHKKFFTFVFSFSLIPLGRAPKYDFFKMIKNCLFMFFSLAVIFIDVDIKHFVCKQNVLHSLMLWKHWSFPLSGLRFSSLAFHSVPPRNVVRSLISAFLSVSCEPTFNSVLSRHELDVDSCCNPFLRFMLSTRVNFAKYFCKLK